MTPVLTVATANPLARIISVSFSFSRRNDDVGRLGADVSRRPEITMREIAVAVAQRHGVTLDQLRGPQRQKYLSVARQEAMWTMYRTGRFSNGQIAAFLGDRDHTTVIHGRRAHEARLAQPAVHTR